MTFAFVSPIGGLKTSTNLSRFFAYLVSNQQIVSEDLA